jgi:hypothetical protein
MVLVAPVICKRVRRVRHRRFVHSGRLSHRLSIDRPLPTLPHAPHSSVSALPLSLLRTPSRILSSSLLPLSPRAMSDDEVELEPYEVTYDGDENKKPWLNPARDGKAKGQSTRP